MTSVLRLLLLVLSCCSCIAHGGDEHEHYTVLETRSLEPKSVCSGLKVIPSANGSWVPLHRPYGPCSPAQSTAAPSLLDMLRWDQLRTGYIRRKVSGAGEDVLQPTKPEVDVQQSNYSPQADVGAGSGAGAAAAGSSGTLSDLDPTAMGNGIVTQTVVIDTSSDVPWIQCLPCPVPPCHPQKNQFFNPTRSTTYAAVPCGSPACKALGQYGNGCSNSQCQYTVVYGDGTATTGTYITDTLTLNPTTRIMNFRFGCSHSVRGYFSDQTAGTMGLGGGSQSLLSQTAGLFGNAFAYCIPPPSSSGFLLLGGPTVAPWHFARTPLIRNSRAPTFYLVRLEAIIVAGQRLNVPPAVFSAGSVMDSSAIVTQLPPTAYRALRSAFRYAMRMYPLTAPRGNLDTCYDFIRFTTVRVPEVSLVFERGAALDLEPPAVMMDGCLAFAATPSDSSVGFIGNVQQQTYEVLYDVGGRSVGFRRGAC